MLLLQLVHDLKTIPTVEINELNTDACQYLVDEEYIEDAHKILHNWEALTGLELEQDKIVKLIQRDVNNYLEILQVGDNDYEVHYKGGELTRGEHKFKWNKEKRSFEYSYKPSLKSNSMSICSEALLKFLLFDIPIEDTINNCNDMIRFQIISHLGSTYEKCVQESPNGDIELQRNNRIYAGKKPSGMIIKVKSDGRRDSLANCPPNPIVDNANELTIDNVDKEWYIEYAKQKANDFLGIQRLEDYKKDELLEIAKNYNIEVDKKTKKAELIEIIKEFRRNEDKNMTKKTEEKVEKEIVETNNCCENNCSCEQNEGVKLLKKINEFRKKVRAYKFVLDKTMDDKHGGGEYSSIYQLYNCVQETCIDCGLDFDFNCDEEIRFEKDAFRPSAGASRHITETKCTIRLTDIDTGMYKEYTVLGAGSDSIDKGLSASMTMAFRQWFTKNFTPSQNFPWDEEDSEEISESTQPKVKTFIPAQEKEEIKKELVKAEQKTNTDKDVADLVAEEIMEVRALKQDPTYGEAQIKALQEGLDSAAIDAIRVAVENTLFDLKAGK